MDTINIPDSPTILQNGTGTPYLGIFNGSAQPIIDPKNKLPIGVFVTSFEYVYDEEDCDEGRITIETDNPDLVALNDLGYYRPLQLQWGYIFPSQMTYQGPVRKVMITGREVTFNETGTHITIMFSDASVILKNHPANYFNNTGGFLEYLRDILLGRGVGTIMVDYRETSQTQTVVLQQTVSNKEIIQNTPELKESYGSSNKTYTPLIQEGSDRYTEEGEYIFGSSDIVKNNFKGFLYEQLPSTIYPTLVGVKILEATTDNLILADKYPEYFRVAEIEIGAAHTLTINGKHPSVYGQIGEIFRWAKNGPYFLDGRDNLLTVHNQLVNRPVSKVYTYAGGNGELLDFKVSSEFTLSVVGVNKTESIDENKSIKSVITQSVNGSDFLGRADAWVNWMESYTHNDPNKYAIGQNSWDLDANATFSGMSRSGRSYVEVPEGFYDNTTQEEKELQKKIEANSPTAVYSSLEEARTAMSTNLYFTKEELSQFFQDRKKEFNDMMAAANMSKEGPKDEETLGNLAHDFQNLGTMYLHRKAKIKAMIDVRAYADPENQQLINEVLSGRKDLAGINSSGIGVVEKSSNQQYKIGMDFLKSIGVKVTAANDTFSTSNPYSESIIMDSVYQAWVEYDAEFEVPIDGTRVIANMPPAWASCVFPAQLEEHTQDQMEASAVVIGDPCLESSMNILIRNVSSCYSGIWYTKKVTHRFSTSEGYKCDIEFKKRTSDVITNQAECTIDMEAAVLKLKKLAKYCIDHMISVGGTDYKGENPDKTAPANITSEYKTWAKEEFGEGEKMVKIFLNDNSMYNGTGYRDHTINKNVKVRKEDGSVPYSHALDENGDVVLVEKTKSDSQDPYFNPNCDGAKQIQNS